MEITLQSKQITDHTLIYLFSMINPSFELTRMRLELEEYDFTVERETEKRII